MPNHLPMEAKLLHIVTLDCKDEDHAKQCLHALQHFGKPDALAFNCAAYEFGIREGTLDTVQIIERWYDWQDLNALLEQKVVPALPLYNQLLKTPFNPTMDTLRIQLSSE